ncbi:MAG: cyclic nucleotide-binding domain-containing protein [Candidatus Eremiobacterota bacterium]
MSLLKQILIEHPFCKGLTPAQLDRLAGLAERRSFRADEHLIRVDQEADSLLLIVSGHVALELGGHILQTLGPGDMLGLSWMSPPYRWKFDGRAVEPTAAVGLDAARLRALLDQDPALAAQVYRRVIQAMGQRLEASRLQLMDLYRSPR